MPLTCYVYTHTTDDGHVFYVGKGSKNRAFDLNRSNKWKRIARLRGFNVEIVQRFSIEREALAYEEQLIAFFDTYTTDYGDLTDVCNFTVGGDNPPRGRTKGQRRTVEQRLRMSRSHRGKKLPAQRAEWIAKRVESRRRNGTLNHSATTKRLISERLYGNQNARKS